jgi:hypothetical protein
MATTYEKIATTTLGSAAADITFTSIPATYTDLRIVWLGTATGGGVDFYLRFNSDTGTNYSGTYLYGDGSSAGSQRVTSENAARLSFGLSSTIPTTTQIDIFSYTGSTFKTLLSAFSNDFNGSGETRRSVHLWRSTSAVTSITLSPSSSTFASGTTATLYGILKA